MKHRPRPQAISLIGPETNEHRTLNVQHRILYSVYFEKRINDTPRKRLRCASETTLRNSAVRCLFFGVLYQPKKAALMPSAHGIQPTASSN
jgi:hypothetical protein